MDGGAWWATVHRVAKSWTQLRASLSLTFLPEIANISCLHFVVLGATELSPSKGNFLKLSQFGLADPSVHITLPMLGLSLPPEPRMTCLWIGPLGCAGL